MIVGLFNLVFRCCCCCCWSLSTCPPQPWWFTHHNCLHWKQCLVTLNTSFWRGLILFLFCRFMFLLWFCSLIYLSLCVCVSVFMVCRERGWLCWWPRHCFKVPLLDPWLIWLFKLIPGMLHYICVFPRIGIFRFYWCIGWYVVIESLKGFLYL
jgi:hypothetical protein